MVVSDHPPDEGDNPSEGGVTRRGVPPSFPRLVSGGQVGDKDSKIVDLLKEGINQSRVAVEVGVTRQYVHQIAKKKGLRQVQVRQPHVRLNVSLDAGLLKSLDKFLLGLVKPISGANGLPWRVRSAAIGTAVREYLEKREKVA